MPYTFTISDATTTSLTPVDIPLMTFPINGTDEIWQFDFQLIIGSSSATGLKVAIVVPLGASFRAWAVGSGASRNALVVDPMSSSGVLGVAFNTFIGTQNYLRITGGLRNGTFGGALQLQAAKVTSGTATLHAGSFYTASILT